MDAAAVESCGDECLITGVAYHKSDSTTLCFEFLNLQGRRGCRRPARGSKEWLYLPCRLIMRKESCATLLPVYGEVVELEGRSLVGRMVVKYFAFDQKNYTGYIASFEDDMYRVVYDDNDHEDMDIDDVKKHLRCGSK